MPHVPPLACKRGYMAGTEIIDFLEKKKAQGFTGCVKMSFEDGELSFITEANHLETPRSKIFSQKTVAELVARTAERGFCGQLIFFFNHGEADFYSFSHTYRGEALSALLGKPDGKKGKKK